MKEKNVQITLLTNNLPPLQIALKSDTFKDNENTLKFEISNLTIDKEYFLILTSANKTTVYVNSIDDKNSILSISTDESLKIGGHICHQKIKPKKEILILKLILEGKGEITLTLKDASLNDLVSLKHTLKNS